MRIDAHQHYWKIDLNYYNWISSNDTILNRDYLPNDLSPHLRKHGFDYSIVVQAAQRVEETRFLLDLCRTTPTIIGVVGWIDLFVEGYREQLDSLRKDPALVGIRVMIQELSDANVILEPNIVEAFRYFEEMDFPVDLLVRENQLPAVIKLLEKTPKLRGVVDHIAKPNIALQEMEPWKSHIKEIASHSFIYCKVSGMVTEASHTSWKVEDFSAFVQHIVESFGVNRMLFGSDWPVCLLAGSYDDVMKIVASSLPSHVTKSGLDRIFGQNAIEFYKLHHLL